MLKKIKEDYELMYFLYNIHFNYFFLYNIKFIQIYIIYINSISKNKYIYK